MSGDAARGGGEGRIHDDGVIVPIAGQKIVESLGVIGRRLEAQQREQLASARVEFVRINLSARQASQGGQVAGARARLQDLHPGINGGG